MIDYELALQLKDAGLPQRMGCSACLSGFTWEKGMNIDEMIRNGTWVHLPPLSELIEACGDRFDELSKMTHKTNPVQKWSAHSYPCEECDYSGMYSSYGSTPEEAVARLWLELNKK